MDANSTQLFELEPATKTRSFTIVRGAIPEPAIEDAISSDQIQGSEWDPQSFAELDELVAVRAALARHNREVAQARMADAERYEAQIEALLRKYEHLVPHPAAGKAWKETTGEYSGGKYRYQPERAPKYEVVDKDAAKDAGLMTTYTSWRLDTKLVHEYEANHGHSIPGVQRSEQCPVSFKAIGDKS